MKRTRADTTYDSSDRGSWQAVTFQPRVYTRVMYDVMHPCTHYQIADQLFVLEHGPLALCVPDSGCYPSHNDIIVHAVVSDT